MTGLNRALTLLRQPNHSGDPSWVKKQYRIHGMGYCSLGVLHEVEVHTATDQAALAAVIREQYPDRLGVYGTDRDNHTDIIASFNDHPDTTFSDIELVFEKAYLQRSME